MSAVVGAASTWLSGLGDGWLFLAIMPVVYGMRHAVDPDHLTAVLTLRLRQDDYTRFRLGLAWGLGHAVTMIAIGAPLILLVAEMPARVQQTLEVAIGVTIAAFALRMLWNVAGPPARTDGHGDGDRRTRPDTRSGTTDAHRLRSSRGAFSIGLLHGAAGSAGVVAVILAQFDSPGLACVALVAIAAVCALAMAACSWFLSCGLEHGRRRIDPRWIVGLGGAVSLLFGVYYAVSGLGMGT